MEPEKTKTDPYPAPGTESIGASTPDADHHHEVWPTVWARCWGRIRRWRTPPRYSLPEWHDELREDGAVVFYEAIRDFDPGRGVPLAAFVYRRVMAAAWNRYRQEWRLVRRSGTVAPLPEPAAPEEPPVDPESLDRVVRVLDSLSDVERSLILGIFWDGRSEWELAEAMGITRQGINKRKRLIFRKLRRSLGDRE